ncbi:UDP-N-acetylmuramoyl-tripeptide--D-alanyl-D-alanine ligase [Asanoa ishikariensis]|uniref:UDP-N-acetylmuramoyl-tripeptide--D-alanyl-D-alanine ligase n=1 Tax=Asanoa ishikariensis TaxID=137265 RepID=A0A1H3P720_9ACTN|nr:UDP-N-acetylmuramoyl-tripeptide--D-alanyl-D-alanine ligase [Asanoa ishikariensis]GIF68068.1 UDP-N-acetylmuramoyl-tripeptide--D-alanyl-D-alanine ligase [Asanoa ishikariensis]SDY96763.1 UDP-N-acetylmuramoyl-tripeptide--D-alanyl-D-alanine ligase [Asanoa ishikariensis]
MIAMRLDEVAAAAGGRLVGADPAATVSGPVEYDSRKPTAGGLFVAFPGEKVDGHDFAAAAVADGAVAVLGTRPVEGVPMVLVDDPLAALAGLARASLSRLPDLCVIGLTGSSGKTTTKDLVAQLVARLGPTVAPAGSLNNELGFPHTVLKADEQTRYLVLEMGARGAGHISYLAGIATPRVGVVLNVGTSHIGEFGSVDNIAAAKGELAEAVPVDGVAILNADDERVRKMAVRTRGRVVLVGESPDADVRADEVTMDSQGLASYTLRVARGSVPVRLRVPGRHQVGNSLAAAAVARELGMPLRELGEALGELTLRSARRMDVFERPDGTTVIDDSYNANPASMAAALRALATIGEGRRTVAVLGYMAELGEFERAGHEEVGRLAAELGVDRVVVVGEAAVPIHDGAIAHQGWEGRSVVVGDQAAAIESLRADLRPGDVVLVKGSRYRTWDVVDSLRENGTTA